MGLPDFLTNSFCRIVDIDPVYGNNMFSEEDWNKGKAIYCAQQEIDLHLDDTVEYGDSFKTPFARLWTKNK